jgi:hypothetical protein
LDLDDIALLLSAAREQILHSDYVVIGSISVIASSLNHKIPPRMLMSNDFDCYPINDPVRAFDLTGTLGEGSTFHKANGFYLDPVSPSLATLPTDWESRLNVLKLNNGITLRCLDPDDAAISKYARGEPRDREWIRAGIEQSIISTDIVRQRLKETIFLDGEEETAAIKLFEEDAAWFKETLNKLDSGSSAE